MAPVSRQRPCLRQAAQQRRRAGVTTDLASGHEEPDRPPFGIGNGVQLGVHAAFGAPDLAPARPFFTPRLDALRCALRSVASIMIVLCSALSAARPTMIRAKTPLSLQRFQRF